MPGPLPILSLVLSPSPLPDRSVALPLVLPVVLPVALLVVLPVVLSGGWWRG